MDWYDWTTRISAGIALLLLLGVAWAVVRGSFNTECVKRLREDIADAEKRVTARDLTIHDKDMKIKDIEADCQAMGVENVALKGQIDLLTTMLTQRADVEGVAHAVREVLKEVKSHHAAATDYWSKMNTALHELLEEERSEHRAERKDDDEA